MKDTAGDMRYQVRDSNDRLMDVFETRKEAIQRTIALGIKFQGEEFCTVAKNCDVEDFVFYFCIDMTFSFEDVDTVFEALSKNYSDELNESKNWFKT